MKTSSIKVASLIAMAMASFAAQNAHAESTTDSAAAPAQAAAPAAHNMPTIGVGLNLGTQGLGAEVATPIIQDKLNARIGVYGASTSVNNKTSGNVNYNYGIKLFNAGAFADYFPMEGSFRLTAGLAYNGNKFDASGNMTNGTIDLNGHTYTAAQVGNVSGSIKYNSVAPYLGIGGGNMASSKGGFHFIWNVGVLFTGSPKVDLNANCGASVSAATCSQIKADVAAEKQKLSSDVHKYNWWPVLNLGGAYTF